MSRARLTKVDAFMATVFVVGLIGIRPILDRLHDARHERAILADIAALPAPSMPPLMSPALIARTGSRAKAEPELAETLRLTAIREGLLIESLRASEPSADHVVLIEIALSGDSVHILRFAESIENRTPLIRFSAWRLVNPAHGRSAKLSATAASIWAPKS